MKQLTMTKVLTPLAALAFAFGVQAATVTDGFETETSTVVTNRTGWSFTYGSDGADDASAITAYDNNAPASEILPDGQSAGSNYLKLSTEDGTLFRNMDGDNGDTVDLYSGLFVDTDVQFTVTDPTDSPTNSVDSADKLVIWLEDQGSVTNLCVLGHQFGSSTSDRSDKVYTLSGSVAIVPGNWYRLTVKAVSSFSLTGETLSYPAFQVFVNGEPFSATEYITAAENQNSLGIKAFSVFQPYIPARTDSMTSLSQVGFSGEGALDNVVVTREVPAFEEPTTLTFTWDSSVISSIDITSLGASLTSSGSTLAVYPGQTFEMTANWQSGYSDSTHTLVTSSDDLTIATVSGFEVSTLAFGPATIALTTTAKDTVDVTFDFTDLYNAMNTLERYSECTAITVSYGDQVQSANLGARQKKLELSGLKVGTNITVAVTYSTADWVTSITPDTANVSLSSGNVITIDSRGEGTATVNISAALAAASINGQNYATFAEALAAANGATIKLLKALTVSETVAIANGTSAVIDLAGNDITGASGATTVFTVNDGGSLTITNSTVAVGAVTKGDADAFIVNNGTLVLEAGNFGGAFSGEGTTYVNGGAYDATAYASLGDATLPTGKALADNGGSGYVYELANAVYTVTYYDGSNAEIVALATNYTYGTGLAELASGPEVAGKTFGGWYATSERTGAAVTSIGAAETGAKEFFAKYSDNTYTITFVVDGVSTSTTKAHGYTIVAGDLPETAARTGYNGSWDVDPVGQTVTGAATYTYTYTAATYDVKYYDINDAEIVASATTYTYGTGLASLASAPEVSGKTFDGWFATSERTGDAVTSIGTTETGAKAFYAKYSDIAPVTPTVDPTDPTTPAEVKAESAAAAIEAVAIAAPAGVEAADYKALFDFSATEKPGESGTYEVTVTGIKDTVEQAVTVSAAEIVDGTSADNKVAVPAGLYYEITTMESLGGTATVVGRGISDGNGVNVSKPGTTQGFIKVKIGTASFE